MRTRSMESRFPTSIFAMYLVVLLLMSGIHTGIIVLMNKLHWDERIQAVIPILYWTAIAVGITIITRWRIQKTYDIPMKQLARASRLVANGDFSVYVPPLHTADKADYLDLMIEDFNKMVEELGSIETLKTDFFSNVSHEIKTPLAVIQSNAELLQHGEISKEQRMEYAEAILSSSVRLSALITNMLKLNKLEKQTIRPVPETYDVCRQLCECALQFEEMWEQKDIEFDADLEDRAYAYADTGLLELVWNNLLSNALKFTPPGGKIILRQESGDGQIKVSVSDTGCGMDQDTLKHIFDKFYQGDTSHSTEGNGLGLALVKRVLELSDGTISVESQTGKGTVFHVTVPASQDKNNMPENGEDNIWTED